MTRLSVLHKLSSHFLPILYNTTANLCMCSGVVKLDWKTSPILWYHHCKTKCLEREEKHLLIAYLPFWHEWYCLVEYHGISENNNTRFNIPVNDLILALYINLRKLNKVYFLPYRIESTFERWFWCLMNHIFVILWYMPWFRLQNIALVQSYIPGTR